MDFVGHISDTADADHNRSVIPRNDRGQDEQITGRKNYTTFQQEEVHTATEDG